MPVDLQIHDLDYMNWILGKPRSIESSGLQTESGTWEHVTSLVEYRGARATVEAGNLFPESFPFSAGLRILCERGAIEYALRAGGASFGDGQP